MKWGYSHYDAAVRGRAAWNAGKTVGTKRPLTQTQIWAIRFFLDREGRVEDRALFDLAIDSKLRGCDPVKIKTGDPVTGAGDTNAVDSRSTEDRTSCPIRTDQRCACQSAGWPERGGGTVDDHAFPSRINHAHHMSTRQYARLVIEDALLLAERTEIWRRSGRSAVSDDRFRCPCNPPATAF